MASIPLADISAFMYDYEGYERKAAAQTLAESLRVHGFAAITGHGLSEGELRAAFTTVHTLFNLPIEEKMKAPHPPGPIPHRGYLAQGIEKSGKFGLLHTKSEAEKAFLQKTTDWKESYDIGHEDNDTQKNIWFPEQVFPGFREDMTRLFERLNVVSLAILEGLMMGMGLDERDCEALRRIHSPVQHQLRLFHYLPMTPEDRRDDLKIRLAPHKDLASFTLLFQESGAGLEFQNQITGEYEPAEPREGTLYLNVGDIMERYSNGAGFYPSAMHRVAIPSIKDPCATVPGRFSIPYFVLVGLDESIYPMPSRVKADGASKYDTLSCQELIMKLFKPIMD